MIKRVFPVLALAVFSSNLGIGIISPILPIYAQDLGATGIWIGILFASFSLSRTILMPVIGRLSDRYGRKPFICSGLAIFALMSLGYIYADTVLSLTMVRLLHGAASSAVLPIGMAYIGDLSPKGEEGKWMGYFNASFLTGFGVGPLLGGIVADYLGMDNAFLIMGGINLIAFLGALIWLPQVRQRRSTEQPTPSFRKIGASHIIMGIFGFRLSISMGRGGSGSFFPIFAADFAALSPTFTGFAITTNALVTSVLQLFSGRLADRFNRRLLVAISASIRVLFLMLLSLGRNFWQVLYPLAILGITESVFSPAISAMAVAEGRKFGMGATMAVLSTAMSLGMVIGPLISGVIVEYTDARYVFYLSSAMTFLGMGLFVWLTGINRS